MDEFAGILTKAGARRGRHVFAVSIQKAPISFDRMSTIADLFKQANAQQGKINITSSNIQDYLKHGEIDGDTNTSFSAS